MLYLAAMRKSRSRSKPSGHYFRRCRHRSQSVLPRSLKKRKNARRLHCLKELENRANYIWNFPSQGKQSKWHGHTVPGLRGGGRKSVEILDYERLASIIMRISISNETSKKEFWKAVAQNYFKMFTVDQKRVERLRLVWRRNSGDIRGRVKKCPVSTTCESRHVHAQQQCQFINKDSNDNDSSRTNAFERKEPGGDQVEPPDVSEVVQNSQDSRNIKENTSSLSHGSSAGIDDFFGRVVGRAVVTVYNEILSEDQHREQEASSKGQKTPSNLSNIEVGDSQCYETSTTPIQSPGSQSANQHLKPVEKSSNDVYHIDTIDNNTSLTCYEPLDEDCADNGFLDMSAVSSVTAKTLSGSNVPSSGIFRATLTRPASFVVLPIEWRNIPIKVITGKNKYTHHRAFGREYVAFFSNILKRLNSYCCWIFKKNYIKQEDSRKKEAPYWRGHAVCKYRDVKVQLKIADKEKGVLEILFSGDVKHDITQPKAKRIKGQLRQNLISEVWKTNDNPSKLHRDSLLNIDSDAFSAGVRTGAGVTHGTMRGIKSESKKKHQSDINLVCVI